MKHVILYTVHVLKDFVKMVTLDLIAIFHVVMDSLVLIVKWLVIVLEDLVIKQLANVHLEDAS